jgi:hypothetical protein
MLLGLRGAPLLIVVAFVTARRSDYVCLGACMGAVLVNVADSQTAT